MNWRNCITLTKLLHPMWRNCILGDLISSVRIFWFQHSTNYTIFNLKCISIKENTFNFHLHSYVRMKYTACFADIHRKRRYDELTSPYVTYIYIYIYIFLLMVSQHWNIFSSAISSQRWDGTGFENPFSWKTGTRLYYIVNTTAADNLATQGARLSATIALTSFSRRKLHANMKLRKHGRFCNACGKRW